MKQLLLFILIATFAVEANAQSTTNHQLQTAHQRIINGLLQKQTSRHEAAMKTTAGVLKQRVIGQSVTDYAMFSLADSIMVNYSGNVRGSEYDYNFMIYPYNYPYATSPMFDFAGVFTTPQVAFDTFVHWTIDPFAMPMYQLYEGAYATYDTNSNMTGYTELFVDSATNDNRTFANSFTTFNKIDTGLWFNLSMGVADSAFKQIFTYDTLKRLTADTLYELHLGVWRIAGRTYYTYDTSNNLILIDHYANLADTSFLLPLDHAAKYENTYDASNRLVTVLTSLFDGTALGQYVKDTLGYSGALPYHNSWKQHQFDAIHGTWWPQYYMSKHIGVSGLPDTVFHNGWDSIAHAWVPTSKDVVHYNSYSNPDTMKNYLYNWTAYSATPDFKTIYFYDTFTYVAPVTSINKTANNLSVNLYPNPATNTLNISIANPAKLSNNATLSVYNVNGQIQTRQSVGNQNSVHVSISGYASGIYWVIIQDAATGTVARKQFVKL